MGFLGLRRSPLKHADPRKREQAVRDLPVAEQGQLIEFALGDDDPGVRLVAATKVREPEFLAHLARHKDEAVAKIARDRLANVAVESIKGRKLAAAKPLLAEVREQSALVSISLQADDPAVREAAFDQLLGLGDPSPKLLGTIAIQEESGRFGERALPLIDKRQVLKDIAKKAKSETLRAAAAERIRAQEAAAAKPKPEQLRRERTRRLAALVERAEALATSEDWHSGAAAFAAIELEQREVLAAYPGIDEDRHVLETGPAIARARGRWDAARSAALEASAEAAPASDVPADTEGESEASTAPEAPQEPAPVAEPEALEPERQAKLDALQAEAEELSASEDWRAADYRFKELDKEWRVHLGELGSDDPRRIAFLDAYHRFKDRRRADRERRDEITAERVAQMERLCGEAERMAEGEPPEAELEAHASALKALQARWREVGKVPAAKGGEVRKRFRAACDRAFLPVKKLHEARDWERFANVPKAEELIARARALDDRAGAAAADPAENGVTAPDAAAAEAEPAPQAGDETAAEEAPAAAEPQADSDDQAVDQSAATDDQRVASAPVASAAPVLSDEEAAELERLHVAVKAIQAEWKELGPLPRERKDELWQAFKAACDVVYDRVRPLFAARDAKREAAAGIKEDLIGRLQAVLDEQGIGLAGSHADRELQSRKSESVKALQAEWKAAGPAPRSVDQQLWKRFKVLLDRFYDQRREQFKVLDSERVDALNDKLALIASARELAEDAERHAQGQAVGRKDEPAFLKEVKDLQRRFREVGHVPRDRFAQVRDDFKAACDRVYAVLEPWFAKQDEERSGNLEAKRALLTEIEELLEEERPDWFIDEVKAIQQKWKEIGQVPRAEMAVNDRFRELCDRIYDQAKR